MIKTQLRSDQAAMSLSIACLLHCFFAPSVLILGSGYFAFNLGDELIHKIIVILAIPFSFSALYFGYKNHNSTAFIAPAIFGLLLLIIAVTLGDSVLGESGERILTLVGSILLAFAHFRNFQTCKALS